MEKSYFKSPIGILEIISDNDVLISLKLVESFGVCKAETDFIKNVKKQLGGIFFRAKEKF